VRLLHIGGGGGGGRTQKYNFFEKNPLFARLENKIPKKNAHF
jgi:hypothetical protein